MERKVMVVCAVVGFLGVLSAALGFAAEATRVKVRTRFSPSLPAPAAGSWTPRRVSVLEHIDGLLRFCFVALDLVPFCGSSRRRRSGFAAVGAVQCREKILRVWD